MVPVVRIMVTPLPFRSESVIVNDYEPTESPARTICHKDQLRSVARVEV